jgi:hypothetical protein
MKRLMTWILIIAASTLSIGFAQTWTQEPTNFRGVPWGATEKEAKKIVDLNCVNIRQNHRGCVSPFQLNGHEITPVFMFLNGKLGGVSGRFKVEAYPDLRTAFVDKYGAPSSTERSTVQNKMGASFEQESLVWDGPTIYIHLTRLSDTVTNGSFSVGTKNYFRTLDQEAIDKKKTFKDAL